MHIYPLHGKRTLTIKSGVPVEVPAKAECLLELVKAVYRLSWGGKSFGMEVMKCLVFRLNSQS
jgi:hypothetical protein